MASHEVKFYDLGIGKGLLAKLYDILNVER